MSKRRLPNTNSPVEVLRAFQLIYEELDDADLQAGSYKIWYVFDDVEERDAFFASNPDLLEEDLLIAIKDTSPPPTPGVRNYDFSKPYNSQYKLTAL